jgi:PAS domain S-box-containing protein
MREVIARNVNMLMPSPYHEEHDTYLARHLATGVQKIIGTGREVVGLRQDGSTFPLQSGLEVVFGGEYHASEADHNPVVTSRTDGSLAGLPTGKRGPFA